MPTTIAPAPLSGFQTVKRAYIDARTAGASFSRAQLLALQAGLKRGCRPEKAAEHLSDVLWAIDPEYMVEQAS